jgi:dihydrofolate synthase/folylpolyglutamate synthase
VDYRETVEFLYKQLPYFNRDGKAAIKADLKNTLLLCEALGNPQNQFKCIHVAGTNGKGSVSHMLSAILQANGIKTGLYTSPHLKDFRERIKVDGELVNEAFVIEFTKKMLTHIEKIQPSFFELTVAMSFDYFAEQKIEFAVIETGMGGRLDSTNIILPVLSVITNIGMDHKDLLGDTIQKIASEKAGIIKSNVPVVIGESSPEYDSIFIEKAKETNSEIFFADTNINYYNTEIETDLLGDYQQKNCVTTMQAVDILSPNILYLDPFKVAKGLQSVKNLNQFRGRWEILNKAPLTIADTGHNSHGMRLVVEQLKKQTYNHLHIVFGMVSDKDIDEVLELMPKDATYYFCKANIFRALDASTLKLKAAEFDLLGNAYSSVEEAFNEAKKQAGLDDCIFIGGSTFVVAEVL